MTYAYVSTAQQGSYTASGTTFSANFTYAAGESAAIMVNGATITQTLTGPISDGTNTYTLIAGPLAISGNTWYAYACINPTPGTYSVGGTWSASIADLVIERVGKYTGVSGLTGAGIIESFLGVVGVLTSSSFTPGAQPYALVGIMSNGFNISADTAAGTGIDRGVGGPGSGYQYNLQDQRVTNTSAQTTSWNDTSVTGNRVLVTFGLLESSGGGTQVLLGQACQ